MKSLRIVTPPLRIISTSALPHIVQVLVLLVTILTGFVPALLNAQQASSTSPGEEEKKEGVLALDPYTISDTRISGWNSQKTFSGRRSAGELLELPTNISILPSDFLKDIGARNILETLNYAASGVTNRVGYREDFTIRGFRQAPLRDGTPYPQLGFTPFYDIERVEIIKGPTALMFGTFGNLSGSINYVTKRPTSYNTGDASFTAGSYGLYAGSVTQRGPLTENGNVRYRVSVGMQYEAGWLGSKKQDNNEYHNNLLYSMSVDWNLTKKLELRFDAGQIEERNRSYALGLADPVTKLAWSGSANGFSLSSPWSYSNLDTKRIALEAILSVTPEFTVRARHTSYAPTWDYNFVVAQLTNFVPSEFPNYTKINGLYAEKFYYPNHNKDTYLDSAWIKKFGFGKSQLNVGFQYFDYRFHYSLFDTKLSDIVIAAPVSARDPMPNTLTPSGSGPQTQAAAAAGISGGWTGYIQETLTVLNDRLIFSAGMLYVDPSSNRLGKRSNVPNYGVVYRLTNTISVYGSYGKSFVPRSGFDSFGTPLVNTLGDSKEIGVKFNALQQRFFGTIAYFDISNDPVLTQVQKIHPVTGNLVFGNAQVGKQTNKGFEADIGWVQKIGTNDWSTYATAYSADPLGTDGLQPSRAIKEKYTLFTTYKLKAGALKGFSIGGGATYVGDSPGVGFPTIPAYKLFSGYLSYARDNYSVSVNIDNLANKRGIITGAEAAGSLALAPPRTIKVTVSTKW